MTCPRLNRAASAVALMMVVASMVASPASGQVNGPSGGASGRSFQDPSDCNPAAVRIWHGQFIDAVQMVCWESGKQVPGVKHGGGGGDDESFELSTDEHIVAITGRYGQYVDCLQVVTNKRISQSDWCGPGGAAPFKYEAPPGYEIVGFWGRSGQYVDAIAPVIRLTSIGVSAGPSQDLDASRPLYGYEGRWGIVGMGIAGSDDHVYAWYADGTVSSGTSKDLGAYASPAPYTLASGKTPADIVDMGIAGSDDVVYAWYGSAGRAAGMAFASAAAGLVMGPTGGTGGMEFEDPSDCDPAAVRLWYAPRDNLQVPVSVQMVCLRNGRQEPGAKHGYAQGQLESVELDKDEHIVAIKGGWATVGDPDPLPYVHCLQVVTDKKASTQTYCPSLQFAYEAPPGYEIVGFSGRSGERLDAIGVVMRAIE